MKKYLKYGSNKSGNIKLQSSTMKNKSINYDLLTSAEILNLILGNNLIKAALRKKNLYHRY